MKPCKGCWAVMAVVMSFLLFNIVACSDDNNNAVDGDTDIVDGDDEASELDAEQEQQSDGDLEAEENIDGDLEEIENESQVNSLRVMTYNILCFFCDGVNYDPWEDRVDYITDTFNRYDPDVFGTQELFGFDDLNDLLIANPDYDAYYYIEQTSGMLPEYPDAAIFYKKERLEIVESGVYWLGENPDEPWSGFADEETAKSKGSAFPRLVAWAVFNDKLSGKEFYFSATHYDNNTPHQAWSAPISLGKIQPYAEKMPIVFLGDFNSKTDTEAYTILTNGVDGEGFSLENTFDLAEEWSAASNQDPAPEYDTTDRIDHIFVAGKANWTVKNWVVDMYVYGDLDRYPSDHFAMFADLEWK